MAFYFKSLSSSSAGNCLLLWSKRTKIIFDCGLSSMRSTRDLLSKNFGIPIQVDSVIVSHIHSDHINHYSLRVLDEHGANLRVHEKCVDQLRRNHFRGHRFESIKIKTFSNRSFNVNEFSVKPFDVEHNPKSHNSGFVVKFQEGPAPRP